MICPNCKKARLFPNVRGGDWFIHDHWNPAQDRLIQWLENIQNGYQKLVILEIGAGFNTPFVTRTPMESLARSRNKNVRLIRINPQYPEVPPDLRAVGIKAGWHVLYTLFESSKNPEIIEKGKILEENLLKSLQEGSSDRISWKEILLHLRRTKE